MVTPRPAIFISAVSKELASARERVADTLRLIHFLPIVQQEFANHTGIVREMLEAELAPCVAVIQIVGHRYGADVYGAADPSEVMSYTQYEASFAHRKPIPIWYLITTDGYEVDEPYDEDERKKVFQSAYRYRLQSTGHLRYTVADIKDVELTVFRMQQHLDKLRPLRFQQLPLLTTANGAAEAAPSPPLPVSQTPEELEKMMRGVLSDFVPALQQARLNANPVSDAVEEEKLYARLGTILGKTPDQARAEIQALARKTKADPTETLLAQAKAAYALKDYPGAETLALQAATEAAVANPPDTATQRAARCQAGEAAAEQIQYLRALEHYRSAAGLTSEERDVLEWAGIQNEIGWLLYLVGQYDDQAILVHRVWLACEKAGNQEHSISLRSRHLWANALDDQGKHAEAEQEHRAVLAIRERVLGPEHRDSLSSRNNLAIALRAQGKHAEAERENRAVLAIWERVLGAEHPDSLMIRMNLANALRAQNKHSEAEQEHRAVLAIRERVLGPEHPDVFISCYNLSLLLEETGEKKEALVNARRALVGRNKVFGEAHPDTQRAKRQVEDLEQP